MEAGKPGIIVYAPHQGALAMAGYAPPHEVHPNNPYVYTDKVTAHDPWCRYGAPVSPERRRKTRIANALAAAFIVCWCCTWPCHGPCCCGL